MEAMEAMDDNTHLSVIADGGRASQSGPQQFCVRPAQQIDGLQEIGARARGVEPLVRRAATKPPQSTATGGKPVGNRGIGTKPY
jgi:hypothetical protein